ncbi:MAG: hypothetical protein HY707_13555 [Ignavibacteriae bacterium]|nr:hypothetical protein [Ignavibacteriota bacterium]
MKRFISAVLLPLVISGCFHQIALNSIGGILHNGFEVLNEEQDLELAEKSIASNIKLLESLLRSDPDNEQFLLLATIAYSSYSLGFVEDTNVERARMFYQRGKEYGMRILKHNRTFADALDRSFEEFNTALASFSKSDVPALFWTAIAWGSHISWSLTDPAALADLPKVESIMKFVLGKDSTFFHGGAHFFLGTLYGSRPNILGGDPEASRRHFESCLNINKGKFLMTYVYYARSYAFQIQNKELFESCLAIVDSTSIDVLPEARLSNAIAKRKAILLREKIDELF